MRGNRKCSHGSEIAACLNLVVIELTAYRRTGSCALPSLGALPKTHKRPSSRKA